ncbi:hypothetical protein P4S64_03895 [Vibrio sp. M60_M31a]
MPQLRKYMRILLDIGYAAYSWLVLGILAPIVWLLVAVLPNKVMCWKIAQFGAKALMGLTGTKCTIEGKEHLPAANAPVFLSRIIAVILMGW